MPQIPYLTVRGKPVAVTYMYRAIIHVEYAGWVHKLKRGETRQAVLDWATEKYATTGINIVRMPRQLRSELEANETEAMGKAFIIKNLE